MKKYIEMSVDELEKEIDSHRSETCFFSLMFGITGVLAFSFSLFHLTRLSYSIVFSLAFFSIIFFMVSVASIHIKNHLSLLLFLKLREAER